MKIQVKREFRYEVGGFTKTLKAGLYSVPKDVNESTARLAIEFGAAVIVPMFTKIAPENKISEVPESKKRNYRRKKAS